MQDSRFEFVTVDARVAEEIEAPSYSYWQKEEHGYFVITDGRYYTCCLNSTRIIRL